MHNNRLHPYRKKLHSFLAPHFRARCSGTLCFIKIKKIVTITALAIITSLVNAMDELSASEILSLAIKPYDKREKMNTEEIIGTHDGKKVKVIYPCGDICPDYTKRVIHYMVEIENCTNNNGVIKKVKVTRGRASNYESFCVPKIIANNWGKLYSRNITKHLWTPPFM